MIAHRKSIVLVGCIIFTCLGFVPSLGVTGEKADRQPEDISVKLVVACDDYRSCKLNETFVLSAIRTGKVYGACRHVQAAFDCQRSSTQDCEARGLVSSLTLLNMKRAYIYAEIYKQELCHLGSSPDNTINRGGAHCSEFISCFSDKTKIARALQLANHEEACGIAKRTFQCSKSAILDCRRRGLLTNETLEFMTTRAVQAESRKEMACAQTTTTTTKSPDSLPKAISCFDFAKCSKPDQDTLQAAARTGDYKKACRSLKHHAVCREAAMEDCQRRKLVSGLALQSMKNSVTDSKGEVRMHCQQRGIHVMEDVAHMRDEAQKISPEHDGVEGVCTAKLQCQDRHPEQELAGKTDRTKYAKEFGAACQTMQAHISCLEPAVSACEQKMADSDEEIQGLWKAVEYAKTRMEHFCGVSVETTTELLTVTETKTENDCSSLNPPGILCYCALLWASWRVVSSCFS